MISAHVRGVDLYGGVDMYGVDLYGDDYRTMQKPHFARMAPHFLGLGADATTPKPDLTIQDLQTALAAFAATGHPEANPGTINGLLSPTTRNAVLWVLPQIPKIPDAVKTTFQGLAIAAAVPCFQKDCDQTYLQEELDNLIKSYASQIAAGVRLMMALATPSPTGTVSSNTTAIRQAVSQLQAKYPMQVLPAGSAPSSTTPTPSTPSPFTIPTGMHWYQTTWGKGAIAVGGVAALFGVFTLVK